MLASDMIDESTDVLADDDDGPTNPSFAGGTEEEVISDLAAWQVISVSRSHRVRGITVPPPLAGCRIRPVPFCYTSGIVRHH